LYGTLAEQVRTLTAMESLQMERAVVTRPAGGAEKVQPKPMKNGVIGLVLGIVLGLGAALLWEALDSPSGRRMPSSTDSDYP
jgi:capsular polysaccharide biosynthesis protein